MPKIRIYQTKEKEIPFEDWLDNLNDVNSKARILQRIDRIELGNFGDCEPVGEGVCELRLFFGPCYRVYFGGQGNAIVVPLCGGDKDSQSKDIQQVKAYWKEYLSHEQL